MTDRTLLFTLVLDGEPRPKKRPRVVHSNTYTPKETRDEERRIREGFAALSMPDPMHGFLIVDLRFYLGTHRRTDVDNLAKLWADALNKIAWEDDWLIHDMRVRKYYTTRSRARGELRVWHTTDDFEEAV